MQDMAFMSPDGRLPHDVGMQREGPPFVEVTSGVGSDAPVDAEDLAASLDLADANFEADDGMPPDDGPLGDPFSADSGDPFSGAPGASLEEEGTMLGNDTPMATPQPRAGPRGIPLIGPDMPIAMARQKGRTHASAEYWEVSGPNGNGTRMVTDGEGNTSVKTIHHDSSAHEHHADESHHGSAYRHSHHQGGHEHKGDSHTGHDSHRSSKDHRDGPINDLDEKYKAQMKREDDQRERQETPQGAQEDQDRDDDQDNSPPPRPVIILSEPPKSYNPTAVVGGLIAIFAQAYLWGNVFVTLFKPQRRAAESTVPAVEVGVGSQNAPAPEAQASQDGSLGNGNSAAVPDIEQSNQSARRFSGASGQAGTRVASAVA